MGERAEPVGSKGFVAVTYLHVFIQVDLFFWGGFFCLI